VRWRGARDAGTRRDGRTLSSSSKILGKIESFWEKKKFKVSFEVLQRYDNAKIGEGEASEHDKPRPLAVGGVLATALETEGLPLAFGLPEPPALTSRKALAPKLMRRANGVVGTLAPEGVSSSKGLSSTEPELALDSLSRRARAVLKGLDWLPGRADRPSVVMESRRGWNDDGFDGFEVALLPLPPLPAGRLNMSTNDDRLLPDDIGGGDSFGLGEDCSEDMIASID
jgi:hypothetical protein